jgi:hypothetical protein
VIDRETGALVLPSGRIGSAVTRTVFLASPLAAQERCVDVSTGWTQVYLTPQAVDGLTFGVKVVFEGEQLDGYSLWIVDARYGTSWDNWSEEKELARRDAHDTWLTAALGPGERRLSSNGPDLSYSFSWGEVWSTFDARGGSSTIGVRWRRDA